jgi:hypothetical protein
VIDRKQNLPMSKQTDNISRGSVYYLPAVIDRKQNLPMSKQTDNISRGSVYYLPRPVPKTELAIMRRLDRPHLEYPFAGSRMRSL